MGKLMENKVMHVAREAQLMYASFVEEMDSVLAGVDEGQESLPCLGGGGGETDDLDTWKIWKNQLLRYR